jgi:cytochrome c oxidase assembly protein Cox11
LRKELKIKPGKTEIVKYSAKNLAKGDNTSQIYLTTNAPEMSLLNFTVKIKIE